ncbi:MAG: hypothetical protein FJX80_17515 [Bacteroidetes bacterium]|nr:hypothetical protein [Bacteroidota bacterium]
MATDKESNGMLDLVTLAITDKEAQKEYNQHKVKVFFEWAEVGFGFGLLSLGIQAYNYWVLDKVNAP